MAKEFTDKSRYKSKYSEKYITAAQYITELVCENMAAKNNKALPVKFWNLPDWYGVFKRQLQLANSLLKIYDEQAIIKALTSKEGRKVWSLAAQWKLDKIIDEFQQKRDTEKELPKNVVEVEKRENIRPQAGKTNPLWEL